MVDQKDKRRDWARQRAQECGYPDPAYVTTGAISEYDDSRSAVETAVDEDYKHENH